MLPNHQEYIRIAKAIFFLFLGMIKMNNYNVPPENNAYHILTYIRRQKREMTAARRLSESSRKKKGKKTKKKNTLIPNLCMVQTKDIAQLCVKLEMLRQSILNK